MDGDPARMASMHPPRTRATRVDRVAMMPWGLSDRAGVGLVLAALALGFVVLGAEGLDVGPAEARLGLAAGESTGPLGQAFGYWAPDLWPGEVWPSLALARLAPGGRATSATVRWPAAVAAILGGVILAGGMSRRFGHRVAIWAGICWFGSLAVIDRSAGVGLDLILGVATLAAIDRLLDRGAGWAAGLWAALAYLAGGWPPLLLIALVIVAIGRPGSVSLRLVLPPLTTAAAWSIAAIRAADVEAWASALTLPLTRGMDLALMPAVLLAGLPWTPFAAIALGRGTRDTWPPAGRAWVKGWLQAALAAGLAGTFIPGLGPAARVVTLAGLLVAAAAALDLAWRRCEIPAARRTFLAALAALLFVWLTAMLYGCFIWIVTMPYYRTFGIVMAVVTVAVGALGWSALGSSNIRRGLVTLILLSAGLKLAHWGYFAPEWNYRLSQGPWGRAIGQWVPRKWPVYTFHDWPADLAFFIGRPVRQLPSPRLLETLPGHQARFVLLQASEFQNWPDQAPLLTPIARFQDQYGQERVLARTAGSLPHSAVRKPGTRLDNAE